MELGKERLEKSRIDCRFQETCRGAAQREAESGLPLGFAHFLIDFVHLHFYFE